MGVERRYAVYARSYDLISGEPVYRAGRHAGVAALRLSAGDRVLDVGCGTGLNLPLLRAAVGPSGRVVGVDLSGPMLQMAARRVERHRWQNVELVRADATTLDRPALGAAGLGEGPDFDAAIATYALSLMPDWPRAYRALTALVRPGGRIAVVDMRTPLGPARALSPLARLACALGGADIAAHPWRLLEQEASDVVAAGLWGGHLQVRAGTLA